MKPFVLEKRVTLDIGVPPQSIKNSASSKVSLDNLVLPSKTGLAKNLDILETGAFSQLKTTDVLFSKILPNLTLSLLNDNHNYEIALQTVCLGLIPDEIPSKVPECI